MRFNSTAGMIPTPQGIWWPRNINQREFPRTPFNACLDAEMRRAEELQRRGGLLALCPGRKWTAPPWIRMPVEGKRFSKIGSIALPPANGIDTLVNSWIVPYGHDGCIVSIVFTSDGVTGFQQGSGDLTWRLKINQRWAKDYGNVTTYIGSQITPYNVNSGQILLQSGQLIQAFVNRSTASLGNLSGGRIITSQWGWTWPR